MSIRIACKNFTGGVPHVDIAEHVELGTFELGDGTELGAKGSGANVSLFITLPLP